MSSGPGGGSAGMNSSTSDKADCACSFPEFDF